MYYYVKKYFRSILTSIVLVISLVMTIFTTINVARINSIGDSTDTNKKIGYKYSIDFRVHKINMEESENLEYEDTIDDLNESIVKEFSNNDFIELLSIFSCNTIQYVEMNAGEGVSKTDVEMYIGNSEIIELPLVKGTIDFEVDKLVAVIGNDLVDYVYEENNKEMINLNDIPFEVGGVLKTTFPSGKDNRIIVSYENMKRFLQDYQLDRIVNYDYFPEYCVCTNDSEMKLESDLEKINEYLNSVNCYFEIDEVARMMDIEYLYSVIGKNVVKLINIVCFFNVFLVVLIWIKHKNKEFAIRKTFGYSTLRIYGQVIYEYMKCFVLAVILSVILQIIYSFIKSIPLDLSIYVSNGNIKTIIYTFVILIVELLVNVLYISKIETINGMKSK